MPKKLTQLEKAKLIYALHCRLSGSAVQTADELSVEIGETARQLGSPSYVRLQRKISRLESQVKALKASVAYHQGG